MRSTIVRALEAERRDGESAEDVLERLVLRGHNVGKLVAWAKDQHPTLLKAVRFGFTAYGMTIRLICDGKQLFVGASEPDEAFAAAARGVEKGEI